MAITAASQTTWHGNPRPVESYATHLIDDAVVDANGYAAFSIVNSDAPLSTLAPAASVITPGPDVLVVGDLDGLWPQGTQLSVAITVTGGDDIITTIEQTAAQTLEATGAAIRVANFLNANWGYQITAGHTGGGNVTISALTPVTGLTITTWAVV